MNQILTETPALDAPPGIVRGPETRSAQLDAEWLLTNGIGGFAMGTVLGVPTRRYHGFLVAAMKPPLDRVLALGPIVERLVVAPESSHEHAEYLSLFHFRHAGDRPIADPRLIRFERDVAARWTYRLQTPAGAVEVVRSVELPRHRNAVHVRYAISGAAPCRLELRPLVPLRDMHALRAAVDFDAFRVVPTPAPDGAPGVMVASRGAGLHLVCDTGTYRDDPQRWNAIEYIREERRGLDAVEDTFSPGSFHIDTDPAGALSATLSASTDAIASPEDGDSAEDRRLRAASLAAACDRLDLPDAELRWAARSLAVASDDFLVRRGTSHDAKPGVSIIAGYPWFADWGRDSMIALPGLLLATRRSDEAFRVLVTFARACRRGLIPNRFDDYEGPAHYNTVDAPLWFVHAACAYLRATADRPGFNAELLGPCADIVQHYRSGTDYDIGVDADGLVRAGNPETQLTWMDAQRDGVTFTPRHGKAVEINALWHNALASLADAIRPDQPAIAAEFQAQASAVRRAFIQAFVHGPAGGLIDHLVPETAPDGTTRWTPSGQVRPNQLFAVSLPNAPLLGHEAAGPVIELCLRRLCTPMGVRTLDPDDPDYRPRFAGPLFERDRAYHNGTVWPWLIGPMAEAILRHERFSDAARARAIELVRPLARELLHGPAVGQLAEVYDGDEPRYADGCMAQAWSVAEVLRVITLACAPPGTHRAPKQRAKTV